MTLAWLKVAGVQPEVRWQSLQSAVVWRCVAGLPEAAVPLWQLAQVPMTSAWLTVLAGDQAVVVWQSAQLVLVAMCVADLPVAVVPL